MPGRYHALGRTAKGIAAGIEQYIAEGELRPGATLPPIRALATDLDVNPNTVSAAYRQLRDRGVIETAGRRGTRVRPRPPTTRRSAPSTPVPAGVRDLADGGPDPALLPVRQPAGDADERTVGYEDEHIEPRLLHLARTTLTGDGIPAEHLLVTNGALDGIERVLAAHLRPGDRIAVEDPGWANLLDLIAAMGLVATPVPLDDAGMLPEGLGRALDGGARAAILTTRAQNPTGAALSADRAGELTQVLADRPATLLVEDDHAAGVAGVDVHPLAGSTSRWAFVRSAAKAFGPDLRLAIVAGDSPTVERVAGRLRLGPGWVSHLLQRAVIDLSLDPAAAEQVTAARDAYARRRAALIGALAEHGMAAHGRSGLNVWVPVADETAAVSRLLAAGWAVTPGSAYRLTSGPGIRISMARFHEADAPALAETVFAAQRAGAAVTR